MYERLGKLAPNYAEIHNNLGLSHKELGAIDRAIEEYKKAVDLRDDAENRFALALLFEMKGDRDGMIREYERFLRQLQGLLWIYIEDTGMSLWLMSGVKM